MILSTHLFCLLNLSTTPQLCPPLFLAYTFDVLDRIHQYNQPNTIRYLLCAIYYALCTIRGGNRAGRTGLGRANSGLGQNWAGPKLTRFFRARILTAQPALKTGLVGPNSLFKAKIIQAGWAGPGHIGPGQIWPGFFWANNLMAQPDHNFGRARLAHRVGPILPHLCTMHYALFIIHYAYVFIRIYYFIRIHTYSYKFTILCENPAKSHDFGTHV